LCSALDGPALPQYETFREMLAWDCFVEHRVQSKALSRSGTLSDELGDVVARLSPIMERMGFTSPILPGKCCALYQRADAAMVASCAPEDDPGIHFFLLGGGDEASLRKVLGVLATGGLEVKMEESEFDASG
jgi:hypothetical protein